MATKKNKLESTLELYDRCTDDPAVFGEEILGVKLWSKQREIIRSAFKHRETAVRSCHNSGKTKTAGIATLGWLCLHPPGSSLVITTSSSWEQVEREIWGEIRNKLIPFSQWQFPTPNKVALDMPGGSHAFGISTNDPVNFHGFHAEHVLVIVDEASGVAPEIYDAFDGLKAGGDVHFLYLMNPTEPTGPSVELFNHPEKVNGITVDGLLAPNLQGYHIYEKMEDNDNDVDKAHNILYLPDTELDADLYGEWKFLIRRRYVKEMYLDAHYKYGSLKPEAMWWPRVRGLPPGSGSDQLIHHDWLQKAHDKRDAVKTKDIYVGIDVAGPGENETALCIRRGNEIIAEYAWGDAEPHDQITTVLGDPDPHMHLYIDANGIGYGLAAQLKQEGYDVVFCNAKNKPVDPTRFVNAKAEWYWKLREMFQEGDIGTEKGLNPSTREQLLSIKWDQHNLKGLVRIEPKEDALKRGVQSPDRAEAMMLCFAGGVTNIMTGQLIYDMSSIHHGSVSNSHGVVGASTVSGMEGAAGPGWTSDFQQSSGEVPTGMQNWLAAHAAQKAANKPAIKSVLSQTLDPIEKQKLLALLQSAD